MEENGTVSHSGLTTLVLLTLGSGIEMSWYDIHLQSSSSDIDAHLILVNGPMSLICFLSFAETVPDFPQPKH